MPGGQGVQPLAARKRPAAHDATTLELPAAQPAQAPEQAAVARPALPPHVPAGQSVQAPAPARE